MKSPKGKKEGAGTELPSSAPIVGRTPGSRGHYMHREAVLPTMRDAGEIAAHIYGPDLGQWRDYVEACRSEMAASRLPMGLGALMAAWNIMNGAVAKNEALEGSFVVLPVRAEVADADLAEVAAGIDQNALVPVPFWLLNALLNVLDDLWTASDAEWSREPGTVRAKKGHTQRVAAKHFGAMVDGHGNRPALQRRATDTAHKKMALQMAELLADPTPPSLAVCQKTVAKLFNLSPYQAKAAWRKYGKALRQLLASRPPS